MLAFSIDYYGMIFRATQSVELFCAYEKGTRFVPDYELSVIADYFHVTSDYLLGRTNKE